MNRPLVPFLLLVAATARSSVPAGTPTFAVMGSAAPPGYPASGRLQACVHGRHPTGLPVTPLPGKGGAACRPTIGDASVSFHGDGPCALLTGSSGCADADGLVVVGARTVTYRSLAAEPIRDPVSLGKLGEAIARSGAAARAAEGWRAGKLLQDGQEVGTTPLAAVWFPGLPGQLTLVKLPISFADADHGPWLAIVEGRPATLFGPFSHLTPVAFTMDGAAYLHVISATCTGCGDVQDDVLALEGGRLRPVFHSAARGN